MPFARSSSASNATWRVVAAMAASLSLSLAGLALMIGVADLAGASANVWMRGWEAQGHLDDSAQWNSAYDRISLARRLNPLNADHSADLGRLLDWQSLRHTSGSAHFKDYRERAGRFYREAIEKRPSWGYAWAHYAEVQFLLGNRDSELFPALEKAILLAPWEPQVQRKVAWIGIASWERLPARLRVIFEDSIRRSVVTDSNLIFIARMATQYNWVDNLVPLLRTERQRALLAYVLQLATRR